MLAGIAEWNLDSWRPCSMLYLKAPWNIQNLHLEDVLATWLSWPCTFARIHLTKKKSLWEYWLARSTSTQKFPQVSKHKTNLLHIKIPTWRHLRNEIPIIDTLPVVSLLKAITFPYGTFVSFKMFSSRSLRSCSEILISAVCFLRDFPSLPKTKKSYFAQFVSRCERRNFF